MNDASKLAHDTLRALPDERVIRALARASALLLEETSQWGAEMREHVWPASGLSKEGNLIALESTLDCVEARYELALRAYQRAQIDVPSDPHRLAGIILAGNVFTSIVRPLSWSLLLRIPLRIKPSSADAGMPQILAAALTEADPDVGAAVEVVPFSRTDSESFAAFASECDVLHVFGNDCTISEVSAAAPAGARIVPHGHGLGAAFLPKADPQDPRVRAEALARDVIAYDQRGCLSPQFVLLERGGNVTGLEFARALSDALERASRVVPRGTLPLDVGASQAEWRALAAVQGELFEGSEHAVSFEGAHAIRLSPGHRNIAVYEVEDEREAWTRLLPLGAHLKCLGVAADLETRFRLEDELPSALRPDVCELGMMQRPSLLSLTDGQPPWAGFVKPR